MKTNIFIVTTLLLLWACTAKQPKTESLFNGTDITGWHVDVPEMDNNADAINPFIIRDGMLVSLGDPREIGRASCRERV